MTYDALVIGGGFFGSQTALKLAEHFGSVALLEAESELLARASLINQARIHGGYHYPRSFLTAKRSRANYARFKADYADCVVDGFTHYYAIASSLSKVDAKQFTEFCRRIDAPLKPAPAGIRKLFTGLVEDVFEAEECVFDAGKLRSRMEQALGQAAVEIHVDSKVTHIRSQNATFEIETAAGGKFTAREIWICAYSDLNPVLSVAEQAPIPLRLEYAEMALVQLPPALQNLGITVMDGPFFSVLPYPVSASHTLSHVRYTPHVTWEQSPDHFVETPKAPTQSHFEQMRRDAARYLPSIADCQFEKSLWEVKALLPRSEENDSRPILFRTNYGVPGLHCILGGKLDNVFDALSEVEAYYRTENR